MAAAERPALVEPPQAAGRSPELLVRTASALVMALVAGAAILVGGWWWTTLVSALALGIFYEWTRLVLGLASGIVARALWLLAGIVYIGLAAATLASLRATSPQAVLHVVLGVIAVDIGAYFAGRAVGGPKIAPRISPSKTWAGLGGGILAVALLYAGFVALDYSAIAGIHPSYARRWAAAALVYALIEAVIVAIVAQAGDFFESWMKRRVGVKDSGHWLPGHGGLFDRSDGLIAVTFCRGVAGWIAMQAQGANVQGLVTPLAGMWQIFKRSHGAL